MTDKELKKLNRQELLELLLEREKENQELQIKLNEMEQRLKERKLEMQELGSLAEASIKLSGVLEAAQVAAEIYMENVNIVCQSRLDASLKQIREAEERCRQMEKNYPVYSRGSKKETA